MKFIDLRSDTVTHPTHEMREAMSQAFVGDDVYEDDPTINELEEKVAKLVGKEKAMFVSSGTMGNQLAIMAQTNKGEEIITGQSYHIVWHEVGAVALLSSANLRTIKSDNDFLYAKDVEKAIRPNDIHEPRTALVCMENALGNGTVVPVSEMEKTYKVAKEHGLNVHLDGARLFNAATSLNVDVKEITKNCDTVTFCLSKGLCAPVGSMLCGSAEFIAKARKYRKLIGGGLRQVGILGAAGHIAVDTMTKRLQEDHDNAKYLADGLSKIDGITVETERLDINMVFFKIDKPSFDENKFLSFLEENEILSNGCEDGEFRFVTHYWITRNRIDFVLEKVEEFLKTC